MTPRARGEALGAPPWLFLWAALFFVNLPVQVSYSAALWQAFRQALVSRALEDWLLAPGMLLDGLPAVGLLLGLVWAAVPWLRCCWVERRLRLALLPEGLAWGRELRAWLDGSAPGVEVRANLLRSAPLALVYPAGLRSVRLGVTAGLLRLWRNDREAAQAALLHELAHAWRGDALILGAGSLFEGVLRGAVGFYLLGVLLPLALLAGAALVGWPEPVRPATLVAVYGPGVAANLVIAALQVVAALVGPLGCVWAAELGADAVAAARLGEPAPLVRALGAAHETGSWWRRALLRLSHPPARGRTRLLEYGPGAWLVLAPALALVVRLLALEGRALAAYLSLGRTLAEIAPRLLGHAGEWLAASRGAWLAYGALAAAWPWLAGPWQRAWGGPAIGRAAVGRHLAWGMILAAIGAAGWLPR